MSKPIQLSHVNAAHLTDGELVFQVPQKYAAAILEAVPELRHSFESLGGTYVGRHNDNKE